VRALYSTRHEESTYTQGVSKEPTGPRRLCLMPPLWGEVLLGETRLCWGAPLLRSPLCGGSPAGGPDRLGTGSETHTLPLSVRRVRFSAGGSRASSVTSGSDGCCVNVRLCSLNAALIMHPDSVRAHVALQCWGLVKVFSVA